MAPELKTDPTLHHDLTKRLDRLAHIAVVGTLGVGAIPAAWTDDDAVTRASLLLGRPDVTPQQVVEGLAAYLQAHQ